MASAAADVAEGVNPAEVALNILTMPGTALGDDMVAPRIDMSVLAGCHKCQLAYSEWRQTWHRSFLHFSGHYYTTNIIALDKAYPGAGKRMSFPACLRKAIDYNNFLIRTYGSVLGSTSGYWSHSATYIRGTALWGGVPVGEKLAKAHFIR